VKGRRAARFCSFTLFLVESFVCFVTPVRRGVGGRRRRWRGSCILGLQAWKNSIPETAVVVWSRSIRVHVWLCGWIEKCSDPSCNAWFHTCFRKRSKFGFPRRSRSRFVVEVCSKGFIFVKLFVAHAHHIVSIFICRRKVHQMRKGAAREWRPWGCCSQRSHGVRCSMAVGQQDKLPRRNNFCCSIPLTPIPPSLTPCQVSASLWPSTRHRILGMTPPHPSSHSSLYSGEQPGWTQTICKMVAILFRTSFHGSPPPPSGVG